jgi:tRNA modification GTPase
MMNKPILKVGGFSDLLKEEPKWSCDLQISSLTGHGIAELEQKLRVALSSDIDTSGSPAAISQRQYDLCISISRHLRMAAEAVSGFLGPAVAAEEIVYGLELIADFNGGDAREKILDRLFSRFCIGK